MAPFVLLEVEKRQNPPGGEGRGGEGEGGGKSAALSVTVMMEDLCHAGAPSVSCPMFSHRRWVKLKEQIRTFTPPAPPPISCMCAKHLVRADKKNEKTR